MNRRIIPLLFQKIALVAMLTGRVQVALILWVVSTLGGIGLLYWMRTVTKRKEEAEKAAQKAEEAVTGAAETAERTAEAAAGATGTVTEQAVPEQAKAPLHDSLGI